MSLKYFVLVKAFFGLDCTANALRPDANGHTLITLVPRPCCKPNAHPHEV